MKRPPVISYRGQCYRIRGLLDHRRLDGEVVELEVLQSWCAKCGRPFQTKSVPGRGGLRRRCDNCKASGRKVHPLTLCKCPACRAKRRRARKALAQKAAPSLARGYARAAGKASGKGNCPGDTPRSRWHPLRAAFAHATVSVL